MNQHENNDNLLTGAAAIWFFPLWLSFSLLPLDAVAETVFRCVATDGSIEFSQRPCGAGMQNEEIIIENQLVGWEAPKVENKKRASKRPRKKRSTAKTSHQAKIKQDKDCWKKKQQIETVQHRLRRGYTAKQGMELRRKRRTYEAYMAKFCR
ncbi:hypothetical protein MNBD_GAMMA26-271 [hydrothermal vent metagenome]|uniref:DUF4124 domain-containing protein n=1 Tax=hydrothermal vent metagenome TaxID=652676 RepID=A0A3B1B5A8_9ZZZZ